MDILSSLFDELYVQRRYGALNETVSLEHYLKTGSSSYIDPNPLFDQHFYRLQLKEALPIQTSPLLHFVSAGAKDRPNPSKLFNTKYYLSLYPDVEAAQVNPLWHFLKFGALEGRWPCQMTGRHAMRDAAEALHVDSQNAFARVQYATALLQLGHGASALAVLNAGPTHGLQSLLVRVMAMRSLGLGSPAAEVIANENAKSDVALPDICMMGGYHHELAGRLDFAFAALSIALEVGCTNPDAVRLRLAAILRAWGKLEASKFHLCSALEGNKNIPEIANYYSMVSKTDYSDALKTLHSKTVIDNSEINLLIIDSSFPSRLSSFRFGEITTYLEHIEDTYVSSSMEDFEKFSATHPVKDSLDDFAKQYPQLVDRVLPYEAGLEMSAKVVHTTFLYNAVTRWLTNDLINCQRFTFTLYPGGDFSLNDPKTDAKLRQVLDDPRCSKVITTQNVSRNYLLDNGFCEPDRILHVFGVVVPDCWIADRQPNIRQINEPKDFLDVCFVAQKYTKRGIEKGIDIFIEVARCLSADRRIRFHVVGNWDPKFLDVERLSNVKFYGVQPSTFFQKFYDQMDIIISANISLLELSNSSGTYDGFPTTACIEAGLRGVALFLSDSLGQNRGLDGRQIFIEGEEFELINRDANRIILLLKSYADNPGALIALGARGRQAVLREYSFEKQMIPRIQMLRAQISAVS